MRFLKKTLRLFFCMMVISVCVFQYIWLPDVLTRLNAAASEPLQNRAPYVESPLPNALLSEEEAVALPVIMYHALVKDKSKQNQYFIDPSLFKSDLEYLRENGYTTVVVRDLIDYTRGDEDLPEKPVMLTFDDGYYNNYLYAYPLLREYGMKAVVSPVGKFTEDFSLINDRNEYYAYMTWGDIDEMVSSGVIEIQNHSYNLHYLSERKGASRKKGESDGAYEELLSDDLAQFQKKLQEKTGAKAHAFVYPYGAYDDKTEETAKKLGFLATLTCRERINRITRDPETLYDMGRYLRPPGKSSEDFFAEIEQEIEKGRD